MKKNTKQIKLFKVKHIIPKNCNNLKTLYIYDKKKWKLFRYFNVIVNNRKK